jgi:hypothetical protein
MTRVEVKFGDLGYVIDEAGYPQQRVPKRRDVGGRAAVVAEQQRRGADGVDQPAGVDVDEGGEVR